MSEEIFRNVKFERIKKVARITFDNDKNNLFDTEQVMGFRDALLKVRDDPKIRALLIRANGDRFSTGFHLKQMTTDNDALDIFREVGQEFIKILYHLTIPTTCLVQSYAIGIACLVPFACDFRFVTKDVVFCLPEINYNFMFPTHGGMTITPKIVRCDTDAKYILMTGEHIKWELADKMGLITKTFETKKEMEEKGLEFAIELSKKNYASMSMIKACFDKCKMATLNEGIEIENEGMMANIAGVPEKKEEIRKFIEKHQLI